MAALEDDVAGLVEVVVKPLLEYSDDLEIHSTMTDDGTIMVEVHVNEEDAGKVIGRQGRVIKAVRTLARAVASKEGVSVEVELID